MKITKQYLHKIHLDFLKSALCSNGHHISTSKIITWLEEQHNEVKVEINKIQFAKLKHWTFDSETKNLRHESGSFFSIDGISIKTSHGQSAYWEQPIINQPEIGYLGFIVKKIGGVLHFLVQAKVEPGNVNFVQLSPTLQATRSNYEQAHKGKKPLYLEYFKKATSEQILLDQLQSEQGSRFLRKRNRNIIIKIDDEIPIYDNFTWLTLAQLKQLMQQENLVNMDTRTVISGIPYGNYDPETVDFFCYLGGYDNPNKLFLKSALINQNSLHSFEEIITFLIQLKSVNHLEINNIGLQSLKNWTISPSKIHHNENNYFKIIAVDVAIENREVNNWCQPMIEPAQEGLCAFVCKKINGILHFAVQAKLECGNHDIFEFAPTVQTLIGNYKTTTEKLPFLEYILNASNENIFFNTLQSEEGGRFYREQNRNMIVIAGDEISENLPENFIWMTLNQLQQFLKFNNYLNIQARSLIAGIYFV